MPTQTVTVDMTGCPCCGEGECCCETEPVCMMASLVGTGDCTCLTQDIVLTDGGSTDWVGEFAYDYGCVPGFPANFQVRLSKDVVGPCEGYELSLYDGAAMACAILQCIRGNCDPFMVEYEFTLDVLEAGADCNESGCVGTLTITVTEAECP